MKSCLVLGILEFENHEHESARAHLAMACDAEVGEACRELCRVQMMTEQLPEARALCSRLCSAGDMYACYFLSGVEEKEGHLKAARRLIQKACEGGINGRGTAPYNACSFIHKFDKQYGVVEGAPTAPDRIPSASRSPSRSL